MAQHEGRERLTSTEVCAYVLLLSVIALAVAILTGCAGYRVQPWISTNYKDAETENLLGQTDAHRVLMIRLPPGRWLGGRSAAGHPWRGASAA